MGHEIGYTADYDIERFCRDGKIVKIYGGTKEIEKLIIARELVRRG
jgi:alkylation response protein AidB-like acyl-CoA dehydrogenase